MAIDFDTDILPLFFSDVANETAYRPVDTVVYGTVSVAAATSAISGNGDDISINGVTVTFTDTGLDDVVDDINGTAGVTALNIAADAFQLESGRYVLRLTRTGGGSIVIAEGTADGALTELGLTAGTYASGSVPTAYFNSAKNQRLMTVIEVVRSYLATVSSKDEARLANYALSRMSAAVSNADVFTTARRVVEAHGNVPKPTLPNSATFSITTASGTQNISIASGQGASLALIVAEINADITTGATITEVEAVSNINGCITFRNTTGNEGAWFRIHNGADALQMLGLPSDRTYYSALTTNAVSARDDALAFFKKEPRSA